MASSTSVVLPPPPQSSASDDDDEEYESEYEEIEEEIEVEESEVEEEIEEEIDVEEEIEEEADVGAEDVETVGEDKVRVGQTVARQENLKIAPKLSISDVDDEEYESESEYEEIEVEEEFEVDEENDEVDVGAEHIETEGEDEVSADLTVAQLENLKNASKPSNSDVDDEEYETDSEEMEEEEVDVGAEHIETGGEDDEEYDITVARQENPDCALKHSTSHVDDGEYEIDSEEIEEEIEVVKEMEVEEENEEQVDIGAAHIETGAKDEVRADLQENLKTDTSMMVEFDEHKDHMQSSSLAIEVFVSLENNCDAKTFEYNDDKELHVNDTGDMVELDDYKDHMQTSSLDQEVLASLKNNCDVKTPKSSDEEELHVYDTSEMVKHDEHKYHMQSSSLAQEVFVSLKNNSDVKTLESSDNEELHVDGEGISKYNNRKTLFSDSGEVNHVKTIPYTGVVYATSMLANTFEDKVDSIEPIMEETNQSSVDVGNTSPRLHIAQIRVRDPLATVGFDRESKKLRIVCEFHAKGWCINGNSCRFLHTMGGSDAVMKQTKTYGREGSHSSEDGGNFRHNLHVDDNPYYGTSLIKGSLSARDNACRGSFSTASHDNARDTRVCGVGPTMDEIINKSSDIGRGDTRLIDLPYSHSRQPLPFGSSSWNTSPYGLHKFGQSSRELQDYVSSSKEQSSPLTSQFESDTLLHNQISRDVEPAKYEAIFSSFDWKPSTRFHPSHELTRRILLRECCYNSLHNNDGKVIHHGKPREGVVLKVDGPIKIDGIDYDMKVDNNMPRESKAYKCFKWALVESVKELLKPTWREGFLSKDAHKLIVQKVADKVLSTLQPHQIPSTEETVKSYLCSSKPKLAKLVEVHLNIYGKT